LSGSVAGPGEHGGDTWKKPNHPTFSEYSKYSTDEMPGGKWQQYPDGTWSFTPSDYNLKQHTPDELQRYWNDIEAPQKNRLILQQSAQAGGQQFAGNVRVPPDSVFDTPQFLVDPDTGNEPRADTRSVQLQQWDERFADWKSQRAAAEKAMMDAQAAYQTGDRSDAAMSKWKAASDAFAALARKGPGPVPGVSHYDYDREKNTSTDADVMMKAIEDRQTWGRGEPMS
jgi:hypothetical protein